MAVEPDCPTNWDYEDVADKSDLVVRTREMLVSLRGSNPANQLAHAMDTRQIHGHFFRGYAPKDFPYFVGHYRGENFRCLKDYEVGITSDPRVGHPAATVPLEMDEFSRQLEETIAIIDFQLKAPKSLFSEVDKLVSYCRVVAALFVYFLEIHPYANGNGHMARAIVLLLLGRQSIYPSNGWSIDPRPKDPPYSNLISRYRNGDHDPLVRFLMNCI
ncbi:Fic/DOC family protein [Hoeflea halophila]|uniref:Fic/DOC family protein n=1 Tax=Hoeflea halophila TaxID=714899 RepID=A0A286ICJ6_9HYPH|nr:Fic family protein [Hoeflea halophila]SOE17791.1 Fic/DOC family protein [Hoeflea halophila]